jgi:DNA-binding response OmpR family regulator
MAVILLVDDDDQFRDMVKSMLERQGHEVETAGNGNEAMKRYRTRPPDLVITDLIMPDKDGLETIRELRRHDAHVRIIAMSGGGRTSPATYLKMASDMGAAMILAKPFSNQQLSEAVRTALSAADEAP